MCRISRSQAEQANREFLKKQSAKYRAQCFVGLKVSPDPKARMRFINRRGLAQGK